MFPQTSKDIVDDKTLNDPVLNLKHIKPKLISTLNHQAQYLSRRKQKRQNRRSNLKNQTSYRHGETPTTLLFDQNQQYGIKQSSVASSNCQSAFYRQVYDGNDKISGYWMNGLLQGEAQIQYHNGDYFRGRFQKGYKTQGLMIFKDHGTYEGQFFNQQFQGRGVLRLKDKTISATWTNGYVEGNCIIQYKNGRLYYGPVKQFKKHGYGYLYFPNDTKFFGQFVDNMIKGYGEFYEKGVIKSKGLWKDGKLIQEKKGDWIFNYEEENANWSFIQDIFNKKDINQASLSFFEQFITKPFSQQEDDDKFKSMLESLKKENKKNGISQKFIKADQIEENFDQ